jgi:hypothetical protein
MISVISWVALLVALCAVGYAWKLQQELAIATRRLDRYNKALFDANDEIRQLYAQFGETTARLRVEIAQQSGTVRFSPDMTVREAQLLHPQAGQVMAVLHLGGCSSCAVEPDEKLAQACAQNGVDVNGLLDALNQLVEQPSLQPLKLPNVAFEM